MLEQISRWLSGLRALGAPAALALALGASVLSFAVGLVVIVGLPENYFVRTPVRAGFWQSHKVARLSLLVAKNLIGVLLLLTGFVLALPLVPGPGALFMLMGLGLLDFPGKRALERRILRERHILRSTNRVRAWFGRAPLRVDESRSA